MRVTWVASAGSIRTARRPECRNLLQAPSSNERMPRPAGEATAGANERVSSRQPIADSRATALPTTVMTSSEFDALIARLEPQLQQAPRRYRFKVWLLALLGNAYIGLVLLAVMVALLAMLASIAVLKALAIKLILVLGLLLWSLLKALKVDVPPPEGIRLDRRQASALFESIERLRVALAAPPFHEVLLTDDFNAAVVQRPRFGLFGGSRNYLLLGLPLMKAMSVPQFEAVLAHELGHLSRNHARMSNWIYRQRLRWAQLAGLFEGRKDWASLLVVPFLKRYAPYFSAYSFPLARASEYEADATSAQLTSPAAAAQALTSVNVVGSYLQERFWPRIHQQADELPQPQFSPYGDIGLQLAQGLDETAVRNWLETAMQRQTSSADTHPALADRLRAIGASPDLQLPTPAAAADQLLGSAREALTADFDERWRQRIQPSWQAQYERIARAREALAALDARSQAGEVLSLEDALQQARLKAWIGKDADGALALLQTLHAREPAHAGVAYSLGVQLLARNDLNGRALIEQAMDADEWLIIAGAEQLRDDCWRHGEHEKARAWHERLVQRSQLEEAARNERMSITLKDRFERHGLDTQACDALRAALQAIPGLHRAWLVRKRVQWLPHRVRYVFGFSVTPWYWVHRQARANAVMARLQADIEFPGEATLICVDGRNYRFGRKLRWRKGSRIL